MLPEQRPIGAEVELRVVEGAVSGSAHDALVDPEDDDDAVRARRPREALGLGPRDDEAVLPQPRVHLLRRRVVPERRPGAEIEPGRIARKPGLSEGDDPGPFRGRLPDERYRLLDGALEVEEDRSCLDRGDPDHHATAYRIEATRPSKAARLDCIVASGPVQRKNQLASPPGTIAPRSM